MFVIAYCQTYMSLRGDFVKGSHAGFSLLMREIFSASIEHPAGMGSSTSWRSVERADRVVTRVWLHAENVLVCDGGLMKPNETWLLVSTQN